MKHFSLVIKLITVTAVNVDNIYIIVDTPPYIIYKVYKVIYIMYTLVVFIYII